MNKSNSSATCQASNARLDYTLYDFIRACSIDILNTRNAEQLIHYTFHVSSSIGVCVQTPCALYLLGISMPGLWSYNNS